MEMGLHLREHHQEPQRKLYQEVLVPRPYLYHQVSKVWRSWVAEIHTYTSSLCVKYTVVICCKSVLTETDMYFHNSIELVCTMLSWIGCHIFALQNYVELKSPKEQPLHVVWNVKCKSLEVEIYNAVDLTRPKVYWTALKSYQSLIILYVNSTFSSWFTW